MKVLLDLRCDICEHVVEDEYDHGGKGDYGPCSECTNADHNSVVLGLGAIPIGTMRQIFSTGGFTLGSVANIKGKSGRTADGTKWEVADRPRIYDLKTGKFGSEAL
jgi:hypothetical protein